MLRVHLAGFDVFSPDSERVGDQLKAWCQQFGMEGLMFRLTETLGSNVSSAQGWQQLEQALRRSLEAGLAPGDIASLLKGHLQNR